MNFLKKTEQRSIVLTPKNKALSHQKREIILNRNVSDPILKIVITNSIHVRVITMVE